MRGEKIEDLALWMEVTVIDADIMYCSKEKETINTWKDLEKDTLLHQT